ncbi:MAG: transposase family protein [Nostoc sp.]
MPAGFENKKSKTKASFTPFIDSFEITNKFQEYFTEIKDPRVERTRYYLLTEIITIALCEYWREAENSVSGLVVKAVDEGESSAAPVSSAEKYVYTRLG